MLSDVVKGPAATTILNGPENKITLQHYIASKCNINDTSLQKKRFSSQRLHHNIEPYKWMGKKYFFSSEHYY